MNDEAYIRYRGYPYTFDEIKKANIQHTGLYKKLTKRWNDHYIGLLKMHPLKLYGVISEILTENEQIQGIIEKMIFHCGKLPKSKIFRRNFSEMKKNRTIK